MMNNLTNAGNEMINGIDTNGLFKVRDDVRDNDKKGFVSFKVHSDWKGQTKTTHQAMDMVLDGESKKRDFIIEADEPNEFLGENTAPNPQELIFAGMNACMMATFIINASVRGIKLKSVSIETEGELNLRGFLGIDATVKPGFDTINYTIRVDGDGSQEEYELIHDTVKKNSPNRFNLAMPVNLVGSVEVI